MVNTIYWFRKALRLHDNPSLVRAVKNASHVTPIFCLDPWFVKSGSVGANRMQFLLESLEDLDEGLGKLDSRLVVLQGNPTEELPRVFKAWGIKRLAFEHCTEPYAKERDAKIRELCAAHGVEVVTDIGHTLCDPADLAAQSKGAPVTSYSTFCNHWDHFHRYLGSAPDHNELESLAEEAAHWCLELELVNCQTHHCLSNGWAE